MPAWLTRLVTNATAAPPYDVVATAILTFLAGAWLVAAVGLTSELVHARVAYEPVTGTVVACRGQNTRGATCDVTFVVDGREVTATLGSAGPFAPSLGERESLWVDPDDPGNVARGGSRGVVAVVILDVIAAALATAAFARIRPLVRRTDDDASTAG